MDIFAVRPQPDAMKLSKVMRYFLAIRGVAIGEIFGDAILCGLLEGHQGILPLVFDGI